MNNPIQPSFKIRLYMKGEIPANTDTYRVRGGTLTNIGESRFIDIEQFVTWPVEYKEQMSQVNTLSFTVDKYAELLLQRTYLGQWVVFFGGYYDETGDGVRKIFGGTITRIRTRFQDDGRVSYTVECFAYGFTQMGKDTGLNYTYPDTGSGARPCFAGKSAITITELIQGIVESDGMKLGTLALPKKVAKTTFTLKNVRRQVNQSDWAFLNSLAHDFGCIMWSETVDGVETINVIERESKELREDTNIQFLYVPERGDIKSARLQEIQQFDDSVWNRPRILRSVTVDENINAAYSVRRSAVKFNPQTGQLEDNVVAEITEKDGKKVITMYEFDAERVKEVAEKQPDVAAKIRRLGPFGVEWSSGKEPESPLFARYYYRQVTKPLDENVAVFDMSFLGIKIKARCNQDLNIHTQRVYNVRGILRYNSTDQVGKYYLMGLTHTWDGTGTWTDLEFMK